MKSNPPPPSKHAAPQYIPTAAAQTQAVGGAAQAANCNTAQAQTVGGGAAHTTQAVGGGAATVRGTAARVERNDAHMSLVQERAQVWRARVDCV